MSFEDQEHAKATRQKSKVHAQSPFAGYGSVVYEEQDSEELSETDESIEAVALPAPRVEHRQPARQVDTSRAQTVDEVLEGERPDLESVGADVVDASTASIITEVYATLEDCIDSLGGQLSKTAPPPETPFAMKLIGWAVDQIVSRTIGYIGELAADELFKDDPKGVGTTDGPIDTSEWAHRRPLKPGEYRLPESDRNATLSPQQKRQTKRKAERAAARKKAGEARGPKVEEKAAALDPKHKSITDAASKVGGKAGPALGDKFTEVPTTAPAAGDASVRRAAPGQSLLAEFLMRQKSVLRQRKVNAVTTLSIVRATAERRGMVDLHTRLLALLGSPALTGWFQHKATMEWLNFIARASMGPRDDGRSTDMPGANSIDGIAAGGPSSRQQWGRGDGFVEITLRLPETVNGTNGVVVQSARIPSSFGAEGVLKSAGDETDADASKLSLASLPVYKRITLQTGVGALSRSTAFIITPDGKIEADLTNPALAAIGGGVPLKLGDEGHIVGGGGVDMSDSNAWARRVTNATAATAGAHMLRDMLRGVGPTRLGSPEKK